MEATLNTEGFCATAPGAIACEHMPLTYLRKGDCARIKGVRGKTEMRHHLENLGFVEGAEIEVVSQQWGNFIIQVKGTQVALDKSVAAEIITV